MSAPLAGSVVNVQDFGTGGEGKTDDALAFQRALDHGARRVLVPMGIYRIGRTLRVPSGRELLAHEQALIQLAPGAGVEHNSFLLANADPQRGNADIRIEGGIWDGRAVDNPRGPNNSPQAYSGVLIDFRNVEQLHLRRMTLRNPESFFIRLGEVRHFLIEHIEFQAAQIRGNQDGVHVGGGCSDGVIRDLLAVGERCTNDDMVALNADDDVERQINRGMICAPIRRIRIERLRGNDVYTFVRILSQQQRIDDVQISDIRGRCRVNVLNMGNWRFPRGGGNIGQVRVSDVHVARASPGSGLPLLEISLGVMDLQIERFSRIDDPHFAPTLVVDQARPAHLELLGLQAAVVSSITSDPVAQPTAFPDVNPAASHALSGVFQKLTLPRGGFQRLSLKNPPLSNSSIPTTQLNA